MVAVVLEEFEISEEEAEFIAAFREADRDTQEAIKKILEVE